MKIVTPVKKYKDELMYVDEAISMDELYLLHDHVTLLPYSLTVEDRNQPTGVSVTPMVKHYSQQQPVVIYNLWEKAKDTVFNQELKEYDYSSYEVFVQRPGEPARVVTHHGDRKVLLFSGNVEWDPRWQGETKFYDEMANNLEWCCDHVKGRMVLTSGRIPYQINSGNSLSSELHLTVAISMKPYASNV